MFLFLVDCVADPEEPVPQDALRVDGGYRSSATDSAALSLREPDATNQADQNSDQTQAEPFCTHYLTKPREGNGRLVIRLDIPDNDVRYTVAPVTPFDTSLLATVSDLHPVGYDPELGIHLLVGEGARVYYCSGRSWFYLGELDVQSIVAGTVRQIHSLPSQHSLYPGLEVPFEAKVMTVMIF